MSILGEVKALENGKGVRHLTDSAYVIFDNPLYVIDSFYNLIAFSGLSPGEVFWDELIKTGTFSVDAMVQMADENIVRDVSYSDKIVRLSSDKWKGGIITGHIFNGDNIWVGETSMYETIPFDSEGIAAFDMLTCKISAEIREYDYFLRLPSMFFGNTIGKLLDKTALNTPVSNPQAQIIHYGLDRYLYVAVVEAAPNSMLEDVRRNRLLYFQSLLKMRYRSSRYALHGDRIVMLMGSKLGDYDKSMPLGWDLSLFERNGLYAGVSDSFEDIYDLRKHYEQASAALQNGLSRKDGGHVWTPADA